MGGTKKLVNETGTDLAVELMVRGGSDPENTLNTVGVTLGAGDSKQVDYGSDQNPYLNGIAASGSGDGEMLSARAVTLKRGNQVDNDLNTHDTITIERENDSFGFHFSNTG